MRGGGQQIPPWGATATITLVPDTVPHDLPTRISENPASVRRTHFKGQAWGLGRKALAVLLHCSWALQPPQGWSRKHSALRGICPHPVPGHPETTVSLTCSALPLLSDQAYPWGPWLVSPGWHQPSSRVSLALGPGSPQPLGSHPLRSRFLDGPSWFPVCQPALRHSVLA